MSTSLTERLRASPTSEIMMEAADHIDGLIAQHHRDSKELRRLCAERDEARQSALDRGFALLKAQKEARALLAERDALREAIKRMRKHLKNGSVLASIADAGLAQGQGGSDDSTRSMV